jgi:PAS domain S-box-containing protein
MPSDSYSFLDVAVLDTVRQRFAAGDAVAILSLRLDQVLWANGPGAAILGYRDIEAAIGSDGGLPLVARRQVMATSGFPDIGTDRPLALRLTSGLTSRAITFLASAVTMPDGEKAIMLALPAANAASRSPAEIAAHAISGFTEDGQFLAFIDGEGRVEAASEGFAALGIGADTLASLVAEVADARDRLVKRRIPAAGGSFPAGFARLADDPPRHLLVVVEDLSEPAVADERGPATPPDAEAGRASSVAGDVEPPASEVRESTAPAPGDQQPSVSSPTPSQTVTGSGDDGAESQAGPQPTGANDGPSEQPEDVLPEQPSAPAAVDRSRPPLRFVWRTDAEGRFSAISPEFAAAVGSAGDIIGRSFGDVAAELGLDPEGEIAGLLERRDTWSGRTVLWPIPGSGLRVPVDLAALPIYGRSRVFEGFRGFGVARFADAVDDRQGALEPANSLHDVAETSRVQDEVQATQPDAGAELPSIDRPPEDPFKGEVPALDVAPKPDRRYSDKIIRLAEHRQLPGNDKGLSSVERSAFREIGERLRRDNPVLEAPTPPTPETPAGEGGLPSVSGPARVGTGGEDSPAAAPANDAGSVSRQHPRGPAREAGAIADGLPSAEQAVAQDQSGRESAGAEPHARADADDIADLARLDGAPSPQGPEDAWGAVGTGPRHVSLLDYAEPSDGVSEHSQDDRAVSPPHAEGAAPAADPDNMAEADFADARDDQTLEATGRDQEPSPSQEAEPVAIDDGAQGSPAGSAAGVAGQRRVAASAPPLRSEGFVPSAFSLAARPDTSILAKLPIPLLIHSGDLLHYANDEFFRLSGYSSLEALQLAGGLDALFAAPYADDSVPDGTERRLRLRAGDGSEFPVEANLRAVPWGDGKALMLVLHRSRDGEVQPADPAPVSAGQAGQPDIAELKARIAEMRTIIDTATDGVVLIDREGMIRSISRPAEALFGFDSDEVAGKPFASLFAIESQRAARDYLASLSEPGVASVLNDGREVIGREAQGRFIPLFMTIGRLPNDSGYCAVVRDITQWKRAEEDLTQARAVAERASSQKTEFLARISHEIRTPLNAIIGFSELMIDEKFGPVSNDRYRDYLRDINRSGNHVLDLVNDLLDISKIEAGQQEMQYEAVSLNDTLAETVAMMQPQANRERVIIRSSFASRLPDVVADQRSIRQIALNVLSNAVRYTQAGGQVIVSTAYEPSGDVVMRVRDTGVGMTAAEIEQALKPFKQLNALKRGRGDGTGLGLPLTKAMVEANRARFTITSTPGEGTLVEVAFPSTRVLAE